MYVVKIKGKEVNQLNIKTKQNQKTLKALQESLILAQFDYQVITNFVKTIEAEIMQGMNIKNTLEMSDIEFNAFLQVRYSKLKVFGYEINAPEGIEPWDYNITEPYRVALRNAEDLLLSFCKSITPAKVACVFESNIMTIRTEALELSLKLKLQKTRKREKMQNLTLVKEQNKKGFTYKIYEGDKLLCSRKSHREYVACYVVLQDINTGKGITPEFSARLFFSRMDLVGKGDSRRFNSDNWAKIRYGFAVLDK